MDTDFLDAHSRHWSDAEWLFAAKRWANADHLYGMAAECGLKRLMMAFGMNVKPTSKSPALKEDWVHANDIWVRYESYRSGHSSGARYCLPGTNPFGNWEVSQRYARQSNFNEAIVRTHQIGAQFVNELIDKARNDGLL